LAPTFTSSVHCILQTAQLNDPNKSKQKKQPHSSACSHNVGVIWNNSVPSIIISRQFFLPVQ